MQEHQLSYREKGTGKAKLVLGIITCVLLVAFLAMATGCRDTDALREIIVDQNSDIIDYDNPLKFYINDSTAEEESDQVSSLEVSDEDPESDIVQNLIIYSSDPNTEGFTAKRSFFSATPDFTGIEASETVFFYRSDDIDAFNHAVTPTPDVEDFDENNDEETNTENVQYVSVSTGGNATNAGAAGGTAGTATGAIDPTSTSGTEGTDSTDEGQETQGEGSASGGGEGNPEGITAEEGGGAGGETPESEPSGEEPNSGLIDDGAGIDEPKPVPENRTRASDPDADPLPADSIATFGEYAKAVQMVGGAGALAATDYETLSGLQNAGVDTGGAYVGWADSSGGPSGIDVVAIVDSGATVIAIPGSVEAYTQQLSWVQYNYLEDNNIAWIDYMSSMNTSSNIQEVVNYFGTSLKDSTKAALNSGERASEYCERHDNMVNVNGGLADGSVSSEDRKKELQDASSGLEYSSNTATFTVLIDDWVDTANYDLSGFNFGPGAAYASLGYNTTPVSFYMQAGGTINTVASRSSSVTTGKIPVLQFAGTTGSVNESAWHETQPLEGIIYTGYHALLDSGVGVSNAIGYGLGTNSFPKAIVKYSNIKGSIVDNSSGEYSLYHPFGFTESGIWNNAIAVPGTTIYTCIGNDGSSGATGTPNPIYTNSQIDPNDILVNPSGYFCDWTQGTVESFLETGFVAAYINRGTTGYDRDRWRTDVTDFYQWAWGITPNMDAIDENSADCVN